MRITNLSKIYKGRYDTVKALDNMTLNFDDHGLVFIVGVSGSGKSTLMNMLSGIDKPSEGDVLIAGKSLYENNSGELFGYRNSYVGLIFQDYNLIEDLNVYENIKLPLELLGETDFSIIDEVMEQVQISDIKDSKVNEISSGQMQRVAIARALVKKSNIILADEPTGNLDTANGDLVLGILKEVSKTKLVVVITHDDASAEKFGDRIIQIEDGKILSDTQDSTLDNDKEELITKEPVVTFAKQVEFTKKFMKKYISRSLTIFLLLLLVPIIGAILAGYAFFNVGVAYLDHQKKYDENYVVLAMEKRGYYVYFDAEEYTDIFNEYPRSKMVQVFNAYIPFASNDEVEFGSTTEYYAQAIEHVCLYRDGFFDFIEGMEPTDEDEIAITDYIADCLEQDLGYVPEKIKLFGHNYTITGIVNTNYEDFLNADFSDEFTYNAYLDNMYIYNSIIIEENSYNDETNVNSLLMRTNFFKDTIAYTSLDKVTEVKDLEVTIYRNSYKSVSLYSSSIAGYPKMARNCVYISSALAKAFGFSSNYNNVVGKKTPGLTMYGRSRILCSFTVGGVFQSSEYEMIMDDTVFYSSDIYRYMFEKVGYGRLIISRDDENYKDIVSNENVVNRSFAYASKLNDTITSGRISMFEILFSIAVILIAFGGFINSYTLNAEKKKIGIKYSLGMSRKKIVLPYTLEYLFDILIGVAASILASKLLFPLIMNTIVYRGVEDLNTFSFFYISWASILGWDLLVALIMIVSLRLMIRKIMKKSPVEIIKDI